MKLQTQSSRRHLREPFQTCCLLVISVNCFISCTQEWNGSPWKAVETHDQWDERSLSSSLDCFFFCSLQFCWAVQLLHLCFRGESCCLSASSQVLICILGSWNRHVIYLFKPGFKQQYSSVLLEQDHMYDLCWLNVPKWPTNEEMFVSAFTSQREIPAGIALNSPSV